MTEYAGDINAVITETRGEADGLSLADRAENAKRKPHLSITPRTGWAPLQLRELWNYRDLLVLLAIRDVKLRYRQTMLGIIWVILQPLLGAAIFATVFGGICKMPSGNVPYFVLAYAGLLGWNMFNGTLTKASACVVGNSQLVSKVYFPRLILPLSTVLSTLVDFAVGMIFMVVLIIWFQVPVTWGILLLPMWLMLAVMLAIGLGLFTSAWMVRYRDLQYVVPVLLQFLLYATPVAYKLEAVPARLRWFWNFNPLSPVIDGFRKSLIGMGEMRWRAAGYAAVAATIVLMIGVYAFRRMERKFADVI